MIFQLCDLVLFLYERGPGQSCWLWFCWEMRWEKMCKIQEFGEKPSTRLCCRQQESRTCRYRHPCWTGSQEQRLREQGGGCRFKISGWVMGCAAHEQSTQSPLLLRGQLRVLRVCLMRNNFLVISSDGFSHTVFSFFLTSDMNSNVKHSWPTMVPLSRFSSDGFLKIHFENTPW